MESLSWMKPVFFFLFFSAFVHGLMAQVPLLGPRGPSGFEERKSGVVNGGTLPGGSRTS